MKAVNRIIDSVWTLTYEIVNDHTVNIIGYNRDDKEGYENESDLPKCILIEDEKRTVIFVKVAYKSKIDHSTKTVIYQVENSNHIFSYN